MVTLKDTLQDLDRILGIVGKKSAQIGPALVAEATEKVTRVRWAIEAHRPKDEETMCELNDIKAAGEKAVEAVKTAGEKALREMGEALKEAEKHLDFAHEKVEKLVKQLGTTETKTVQNTTKQVKSKPIKVAKVVRAVLAKTPGKRYNELRRYGWSDKKPWRVFDRSITEGDNTVIYCSSRDASQAAAYKLNYPEPAKAPMPPEVLSHPDALVPKENYPMNETVRDEGIVLNEKPSEPAVATA